MLETRDLGIQWPLDVENMVLRQARMVYWRLTDKHECEELKQECSQCKLC